MFWDRGSTFVLTFNLPNGVRIQPNSYILDSLRRRLEKRIYIPLPNFESRKALININLKTVEV